MADMKVMDFNPYTKKPVKIQAAELNQEVWNTLRTLPSRTFVCHGHEVTASVSKSDPNDMYFLIDTLEGTMRAEIGDMLIIGVDNEIYACKADIFKRTYDEVK